MPEAETYIRPALDEYTSHAYEPVKLRIDSTTQGSLEPMTVPDLFERSVHDFPDNPALSFKDDSGKWKIVSYLEYKAKIYQTAKGFIKLGLQPHNIVGILAFNCPEWFYSELGAIFAGGIVAGIYTTNSSEAIYHALSTSQAKILIVDDMKQMKKIRQIWSRLPDLKAVIQLNGPFETNLCQKDGYYRWSDFEQLDTSQQNAELDSRINNIAANECCMLVYTSGTVGFPKAVMLSHDNITWDLQGVEERYSNVIRGDESIVTYLPLNHIAAQMVDVFLPILFAGCVYFADRDALKGSLIKTLQKVRPTRMTGVPRVFEKIYEQMMKVESQLPTFKKALLNWARSQSLSFYKDLMDGKQSESLQYKLAKHLVLNKMKYSLGLDRARSLLVGGAPTSITVKKYFQSIDLPLNEVFGMSESTGGHCVSNRYVPNFSTVGQPLSGIATKIYNPDSNGSGEICLKSRSVFMGYLNEPEKTKETFHEDGWLRTGDMGTIDEKGYVYVTGRLKEIIITAGGENIPPEHVECLIKAELPILSNVVLIGDKRKFLTVLVTLRVVVDPVTGIPTDKLLPEVKDWLANLNVSYTTVSEILEAGPCPIVSKAIEDGIAQANKNAISNAQKVQKFAILPQDFSMATEELGPTMKLKRAFVAKKYQDIIEKLYK